MFRSTLLTVLQNGKNDDEAHNSWTKKRSKTSYLSFFFSFGATVSHISLSYIWAKLVFSKKKKKSDYENMPRVYKMHGRGYIYTSPLDRERYKYHFLKQN